MIIGVPKEIKDKEFRVGIVPAGVKSLAMTGHRVIIEKNAGLGSNISDDEYRQAGAEIVAEASHLYSAADMIMKVKEPLPQEYDYLREGLILYTYLHLAPLPDLTDVLLRKKVSAIGYETVQLDSGYLPLLAPMSEVAGRMAVQGPRYSSWWSSGRGARPCHYSWQWYCRQQCRPSSNGPWSHGHGSWQEFAPVGRSG